MSWWELLLLAWALASALQLGLFVVQLRTGSATVVDVGWSASLVGIAALYAALGGGDPEHRILIAAMATIGFGRLAIHLGGRLAHPEDRRYRALRARWRERGRVQKRLFVFFQAQAFVAVLLSVPFLAAVFNDHDGLEALEWLGFVTWLVGALLEAEADHELSAFRSDEGARGRVLDSGVWRYSRHPNYFGQWVAWCGYALVGIAAPWGWIGVVAPALMLGLILFVTGLPPTEEASVESRGAAYRDYQRRTSPFVPWPPRGV